MADDTSQPSTRDRHCEGLHSMSVFSCAVAQCRGMTRTWPDHPCGVTEEQLPPRGLMARIILPNPGDVLFWIGDFRVVPGPLQSVRALRLHRPLRRRHAVHRLCARPACARTDAQQRPWREVHRGPASGAARVSGSVPVWGEGAGTRVRGEATDSRAEGRVGRQRETTPQLNQRFQKQV
jgi:hypothetical protein